MLYIYLPVYVKTNDTSAVDARPPIDTTNTAHTALDNSNSYHKSSIEAISSNNNTEEARSLRIYDAKEEG